MELNIAKWGNSLALRLPSRLARETNLTEGATVRLEIRDGAIVVTPVRRRFELAELLARMPARSETGEFDWGAREGGEAW